jgi:hypothetical protein
MEIKGIWKKKTTTPISVTVNGENFSGIIDPSCASPKMTISLSGLMTLDVIITNSRQVGNPVLLWENNDYSNSAIMQQVQRFGDWESLSVSQNDSGNTYHFVVEELDGGLLIVGTVELVDVEVLAQAMGVQASR